MTSNAQTIRANLLAKTMLGGLASQQLRQPRLERRVGAHALNHCEARSRGRAEKRSVFRLFSLTPQSRSSRRAGSW
jgi:hypothetical protein